MDLRVWVRKYGQLYYGWKVLAASTVMAVLAGGVFMHGFNVFIIPIQKELALSSAQIALIFSIARAEGGAEGPFAGWLIDRFGSRRLLIWGILLSAAGFFLLARVNSLLGFALVYLGVVSLGATVGYMHALLTNVNMWFIRHRAMAMSIFSSGFTLGGAILVPLMTLIVLRTDWRVAAIIAGALSLAVALPLTLVIRPSPESMGLVPDGDSRPAQSSQRSSSPPIEEEEYGLKEAIRTRAFWFLLLGNGFRQIGRSAIVINLVPILVSRGATQQLAANLVGLLLVVSLFCRVPIGMVADRWSKPAILSVSMVIQVVAFGFLLLGGSAWFLYAYIVFAGMGDSAAIISWAALGEYFGRRRFASLRGIISFSYSWGIVAAPAFAGWVFDIRQSWDIPVMLTMVAFGLAALSYAMMRKPLRVLAVASPLRPAQSLERGD